MAYGICLRHTQAHLEAALHLGLNGILLAQALLQLVELTQEGVDKLIQALVQLLVAVLAHQHLVVCVRPLRCWHGISAATDHHQQLQLGKRKGATRKGDRRAGMRARGACEAVGRRTHSCRRHD